MKKIMKWLSLILVLVVLGLFFYQNHTRTPTLDSHGAYLSLDMYFFGVVQKKSISLNWYLCAAFVLGMLTTKIISLRQK